MPCLWESLLPRSPSMDTTLGRGQYSRVRETYRLASAIALGISVGWFAVYQIFPRQIGSLFVSGDASYLDACAVIFRLYMLGFFTYGLHMTTASFFQSIGKAGKGTGTALDAAGRGSGSAGAGAVRTLWNDWRAACGRRWRTWYPACFPCC